MEEKTWWVVKWSPNSDFDPSGLVIIFISATELAKMFRAGRFPDNGEIKASRCRLWRLNPDGTKKDFGFEKSTNLAISLEQL